MSQTTEKRSRLGRFGRWAAELVLVFVGVYAVFWLNNYQQRQQDAERRDRILASIEKLFQQGIESGRENRAKQERRAAEFQRALDAGEMPQLQPFVFITDYSPGDFATMLQSGGNQLLDLDTLTALRNDESVIRWGLSGMARYQKLSDELIVPNLDQDISFFYDPATRNCENASRFTPTLWTQPLNSLSILNERTPRCLNKSKPSDGRIANVKSDDVILTPQSREKNLGSFLNRPQIKSEMFRFAQFATGRICHGGHESVA